jgi:hypothetical protein
MNELIVQNSNLPDKIEDIARFVLVGREKVAAIRAEIRAIEKLQLAEEVRNQKRAEVAMMSEVLLDAEVKLGELFSKIPKATKGNQYTGRMESDSGVALQKCKKEVIEDLGFSVKQAERIEKLADNKDLVEQVKAEARENGEYPTRARVLDLAAYQKKQGAVSGENGNLSAKTRILDITDYQQKQETELEEYEDFQDLRAKVYKDFMKIVDLISRFEISDHKMDALRDNFDHMLTVDDHIEYINEAAEKLNLIKMEIYRGKRNDTQ